MKRESPTRQSVAGFSLIEILIVLVIASILAAIAAPSWLGWLNRQRLRTAQNETIGVLREAQANAKRENRSWEACFRDENNRVQWAVQRSSSINAVCTTVTAPWQNLTGEDADQIAILPQGGSSPYGLRFSAPHGLILPRTTTPSPISLAPKNEELGKITFLSREALNNPNNVSKRCVIVSTLLGAMRTESDNKCD